MFADYHNHTRFSPDGKPDADYLSMARAAVAAGLDELCITEHCECNGFFVSATENIGFTYDREACRKALEEARAVMGDRIALPFGVEIGQATQVPEREAQVLSGETYDFIIGSLHNIRGWCDFALVEYESEEQIRGMLRAYFEELYELADQKTYDVVGHVDYPLRYMRRRFDVSFRPFEEELRAVLHRIAERGKGIELNTKVLRTVPPVDTEQDYLLRLWKEEGGEVLTVGSDAHRPADVAAGVRKEYELAKGMGFCRIATFRRHQPIFHEISG